MQARLTGRSTPEKWHAGERSGSLTTMQHHFGAWSIVLLELVKVLKFFGLIPGALAAYGMRRLHQKRRQAKAMDGWPMTDARILNGRVHKEGLRRFWVELTYSYFVGEYRAGKYVHRFRREEEAEEFIRQVKDKIVDVHYESSDPDCSVILDRDIELITLLSPQYR